MAIAAACESACSCRHRCTELIEALTLVASEVALDASPPKTSWSSREPDPGRSGIARAAAGAHGLRVVSVFQSVMTIYI
jgi:hypothetical protein